MEPAAAMPSTPRWNVERPFLTGRFHQEVKGTSRLAHDSHSVGSNEAIGCYDASVQELIVIDDLLSALVGIEGRYISITRIRGKDDEVSFQIDASMDLTLQSRSQFKNGLVNHAFAAALRELLLDYQAMVAQLEHQFRLGRLSIQGLWFYCQPLMVSMQALSVVIQKASANNYTGSAVLNLLQSQAKAMAGDNAVRSLLERMTQRANNAYLGILERWVYEGVIDDPYGEFFIKENKSLLKESLTQDSDAKFWSERYSLKDGIPSFLANIAGTILTTGKYLNVMRECGHTVQVPVSENSKFMSFGANHHYLECIKVAYDFASGELLNLIKEKYDLVGKLRSIKHYLLLDQGDFLVHFMDIARDELNKQLDEISVEKLQERSPLLKRLSDLELHDTVSDGKGSEEPVSVTGLETFSLSYKVLEPNWHVMHNRLQTAKSIDEVIRHHDFFLEKCLRECLLLLPELLKKMERLKMLCVQYAAAAQWLISSSVDILKMEEPSRDRSEKSKPWKSRGLSQGMMLTTRNATVMDSIITFEKEFSTELHSLGLILSNNAQKEPYLTHLAQWVLGVRSNP
ncbi:hypothetical protein CDL15_Pgr010984 [Punica granatum]|uniref:Gamma-tubulin complex component n=1 Tax=Punica granatum TaxID=22663 RepID=A0A218XMY6_PUNGR|nr:hypothetical protein CDL15_Pgr010984 [Punica granatum]